MTKLILHGGATSTPSEDNKNFFFEMTHGLSDPVAVLCVYFARPHDEWDRLFKQDKENFTSAAPGEKLEFFRADENPDTFTKQIKQADVIYMRGGKTDMLIEALKKVDFPSLTQGKVVSGCSAGATALSTYGYSGEGSTKEIKKGFGILPIKTFVHYTEDQKDALKKLEEYGEELPVYKIPEGKFVVLEK